MPTTVVLTHAASTWFLTGLIWTIQVVHYPLFAAVGEDRFVAYEAAHSTRITWIIAVPWALQGLTTAALLVSPPDGVGRGLVVALAVLAAIPVLVTMTRSIPAHTVLSGGFDAAAHARLTSSNWLRTAAWSAHAVLVVPLLLATLGRGR